MALAPTPNPRASLLAGLRTGGVRPVSTAVPHTATLGSTFNVPRFSSQNHSSPFYEDEVEAAHLAFNHHSGARHIPVTAAVDGLNNNFATQQMATRPLNPNSAPYSPMCNSTVASSFNATQMQNKAFQMQMLQLEMLRIQNLQAQQLQVESFGQFQRHLDEPYFHGQRCASYASKPPSGTATTQIRRSNQVENLRSRIGQGTVDNVPMTAALGGKFGCRTASSNISNGIILEVQDSTNSSTTVISGGTSLGNPASNNLGNKGTCNTLSKSDSASTWRRAGSYIASAEHNRAVSSPTVKITPPIEQSALSPISTKLRPQPLRFSSAAAQPVSAVTVEVSDGNDTDDASSSSSAASNSSPNTPRSSSSNGSSLSPRDEVTKKMYDSIGIGHPASAQPELQQLNLPHPLVSSVGIHRMVSQPTRQPRGPPSGADELGPKNFASRIRRQAIDGLGLLMDARERRELVEAY